MNPAELVMQITPGNWGIIVTLVGIAASWFFKQWKETRQLTAEERLAKREGFTKQLELAMAETAAARAENRLLSQDMQNLRAEYNEHRRLCYAETEQLRNMLIAQSDEIEGLKRRIAQDALELSKLRGGMV